MGLSGSAIGSTCHTGHIGEWIAARIFDIELENAANAAGIDGRFTTGLLAGRTVNVKTYGKQEGLLDMKSTAPLDYYLVLSGRRSAPVSSRGALRPFCIDGVYLFDEHRLRTTLGERGIKFSEATIVRAVHWDEAEIYPRPHNPLLVVTDAQQRQLAMFGSGTLEDCRRCGADDRNRTRVFSLGSLFREAGATCHRW